MCMSSLGISLGKIRFLGFYLTLSMSLWVSIRVSLSAIIPADGLVSSNTSIRIFFRVTIGTGRVIVKKYRGAILYSENT